ncbi:hypothetical protein RI367_001624 [Sorochytrium milnesiophthora]
MAMALLRTFGARKTVESLRAQSEQSEMHRALGALDVTLIGIGEIIGAGIFVFTGKAASRMAGPAIILVYIMAGLVCGFAGLCYSEMASMIPVSGSAYTYCYATTGELIAWIIGWDLTLEYMVGAAAVSAAWSDYLMAFLKLCGANPDPNWFASPLGWDEDHQKILTSGDGVGYINLPALLLVLVLTTVLVIGVKQSAWFNHTMVGIKISIILIFLFATFGKIDTKNWSPFFIPYDDTPGAKYVYGFQGIKSAIPHVFFAYIGFDAVSTCAQETRNPGRDMPIGIMGSLLIATVLYILVCLNLTAIVPYTSIRDASVPLVTAVSNLGMHWLGILISLGALAGLTSVVLVSLLSQPRIFASMANDGLMPAAFGKIHPRFGTPYIPTIMSGVFCAIAAAVLPVDLLGEVTSAGTLFAFALVCLSVGIMRFVRPDIQRRFRVPFGPILIPFLGFACSIALLVLSGGAPIPRVFIWMAIGLVIYGTYGYRHSKLRRGVAEKEIEDFALQQREKDVKEVDV